MSAPRSAIVMAGGEGSRLGYVSKPLIKVCGKAMLEAVLEAASRLSRYVYVVTTPKHVDVIEFCRKVGVDVMISSSGSYVEDLRAALEIIEQPTLVLPADTPFITSEILEWFTSEALSTDADVVTLVCDRSCFPEELRREPSPTGISLFKSAGGRWRDIVICRYPELLDVDTEADLRYALRICGGRS